ncbi:FAD-binding oxidoreductase [Flavobacteriaceae bacterium F89]|uniref:FAD-binding oxidoreductase n=1 Tax=Cerina litoralis TaxID=2874477 RepID=A0AAE3F009_9FLAO|nr:FAD-dependent oxidoreductase [Cerina litoralis]MCG2462771.1 FAD-binding oxidoreductase [Cerina litoralis]
MVDYLIVGLGLAGISFCEVLERHDKSFYVIADGSQTSSLVAGGLYNPVTLKRFKPVWNAREQLDFGIPFYKDLEKKLNVQLEYKVPILRRFVSVEEQNSWFEASDRPLLQPFLSTSIQPNTNPKINAPLGYGEVLHTGRVATKVLLAAYSAYLLRNTSLIPETFDYGSLKMVDGPVEYRSVKARNIVFAEGYGLKKNPSFKYLPLNGTKGELLTIKAPDLKESRIIKSSVFIIPLGDDLYRVGATYSRKDKSNLPTEEARLELLEKLNSFLECDYKVVDQVAGVRPTVSDRRPLVGRHPIYGNRYVLNGLGSRGVMIGPWAANLLFNNIENGIALPEELDIARFTKKYFNR